MKLKKRFLLLTRTLHIYLSMLALLLVLFFSVTGFLMNHSEWFSVDATTTNDTKSSVPIKLIHPESNAAHPDLALVEYLRGSCGAKGNADMSFSMDDDPLRITFKGPHYRFDAEINKADGRMTITKTTSSFSGFLGNLHKGENTGEAWHRVIDATSILLVLVSITGLLLWMTLAKRRTIGLIAVAVCVIVFFSALFIFVP